MSMRVLTYLNTSDFVNHVDQASSIKKYNTASAYHINIKN